VKAVSTMRNFV